MISEAYNIDCLQYMQELPDNAFELVIADPPYGIGEDGAKNHSRGNFTKMPGGRRTYVESKAYTPKEWDRSAPDKEFFNELCRVSRHQILWGANHYIENLPRQNASCWVVWDKDNGENDFADCELAWTSLPCAVRRFRYKWHGMLQENMAHKEERIHPTQKPVALYAWLLKKFAKPGDRIFDPMMGSQSSRIAAYKMGFDYVGCELDKDYFDQGCKRFNRECRGIHILNDGRIAIEQTLFDDFNLQHVAETQQPNK